MSIRRLTHLALITAAVAFVSCSAQRADDPATDENDQRASEGLSLSDKLDAEERAFFQLINDYRVSQGKSKLQVSIALTDASKFHSNDLATKNYFSHTSQDGTTFDARIKRYYDHPTYLGENIAAGYSSAQQTFDQWKNSPGHNANMLGDNYVVLGIGRAYSATSTYGWYWTTDFGGYLDATLSDGGGVTPPPPPPPPPPTTTNLLTDGGFESSSLASGIYYSSVRTLGRWSTYATSGGSATIDARALAAGSKGLRVVDPDPGYVSIAQVVAGSASTKYQLTARARRVSGSTPQSMWIDSLDSSFRQLSRARVWTSTASTFESLSTTATAPAGTAYVRVVLFGSSYSGYTSTFDWDDVTLSTSP